MRIIEFLVITVTLFVAISAQDDADWSTEDAPLMDWDNPDAWTEDNWDVDAKGWEFESLSFTAIEKSDSDKYWMTIKYGPNNNYEGVSYAYIYMEIGGDKIADGAVVATRALIFDELHFTRSNGTQFSDWYVLEIAECRVIYNRS